MKQLVFLVSFFLAAHVPVHASINPDDIIGVWIAGGGKGHIQIFKQNGKYYGKILWLRNPKEKNGEVQLDRKNPDPALRNKPIIGTLLLKNFVYKDGEWTDGVIYDTAVGKEYEAYIKLKNKNTLALRGYIGFTWMGKTDIWTRVK